MWRRKPRSDLSLKLWTLAIEKYLHSLGYAKYRTRDILHENCDAINDMLAEGLGPEQIAGEIANSPQVTQGLKNTGPDVSQKKPTVKNQEAGRNRNCLLPCNIAPPSSKNGLQTVIETSFQCFTWASLTCGGIFLIVAVSEHRDKISNCINKYVTPVIEYLINALLLPFQPQPFGFPHPQLPINTAPLQISWDGDQRKAHSVVKKQSYVPVPSPGFPESKMVFPVVPKNKPSNINLVSLPALRFEKNKKETHYHTENEISPDIVSEGKEVAVNSRNGIVKASILAPKLPADHVLTSVIRLPSVVLIVGIRGAGKTANALRIGELFHFKSEVFLFGFPVEKKHLLPDWIGIINRIDDIPQNAIIIIDEAYLYFNSRRNQKETNLIFSKLFNLSRQCGRTFIIIAQDARQIDPNVIRAADIWIVKPIRKVQFKLERPEIREIFDKSRKAFEEIPVDERIKYAYIEAPDAEFSDLLEMSLPECWSEDLSCAWGQATAMPEDPIYPTPISREEKIKKVIDLWRLGHSHRDIVKLTGVPKTTVTRYINKFGKETR